MTAEPAPIPPLEHTMRDDPEATRLFWQVLHLCNILLSQFAAYLSLEALHCDATSTALNVPAPHLPLMTAQATMMVDGCKNLNAAADELVRTSSHQNLVNDGSYQSTLNAAKAMSSVVDVIKNEVSSKEDVDMLRKSLR